MVVVDKNNGSEQNHRSNGTASGANSSNGRPSEESGSSSDEESGKISLSHPLMRLSKHCINILVRVCCFSWRNIYWSIKLHFQSLVCVLDQSIKLRFQKFKLVGRIIICIFKVYMIFTILFVECTTLLLVMKFSHFIWFYGRYGADLKRCSDKTGLVCILGECTNRRYHGGDIFFHIR